MKRLAGFSSPLMRRGAPSTPVSSNAAKASLRISDGMSLRGSSFMGSGKTSAPPEMCDSSFGMCQSKE
jgi:hypothetical protein